MSNTWARLTGPEGDRPDPLFFAAPIQSAVIALASPFVRYDTSWTNPTVYRTQEGLCFMEGLIRRSDNGAIAGGALLCTLPAAYCPAMRLLLNGVGSSDGTNCFIRVDLEANGNVTFQASVAACAWISMTGKWYAGQ